MTKEIGNNKSNQKKEEENNLPYRVFENKDYIKVSKTTRTNMLVSIHPYLKNEYIKLVGKGKTSKDFEAYVKEKLEEYLGKKIVLKK